MKNKKNLKKDENDFNKTINEFINNFESLTDYERNEVMEFITDIGKKYEGGDKGLESEFETIKLNVIELEKQRKELKETKETKDK